MKYGLSSYAYGWAIGFGDDRPARPLTAFNLLERAASLGAEVVQIADNLPLEKFSRTQLRELRDFAGELNISIEVGARRLSSERMEQYAEIADLFGSPIVRFVIDDMDYHPSMQQIREILRTGLPQMGEIVLAIENHDRFSAVQMKAFVEESAATNIGICLDTANSFGAGEGIETVLQHLAPITVNLHLKDIVIRRVKSLMGFTIEGRPAGEGQLDLPAIVRQVQRHRRCASALLEVWTPPAQTLEETVRMEADWVDRSWKYLNGLSHEGLS